MVQFTDRVEVSGVQRRSSDGALLADARIARTGIQVYLGREVDPDNEHGFRDKQVRVYRPGSEVFSRDTLASAAHRPVTNNHPDEVLVDEKNWSRWAVGHTADEVRAEGIYVRVPLMVSDGAAIDEIEAGKRELSSGYTSVLDWTAGTNDAGEDYDVVQRNIRINHVAIVQRGRAGSMVRIGDEAADWGVSPVEDSGDEGEVDMTTPNTQTVTVDGISVEVTPQGAQVIAKLQTTIDSLGTASRTAETAHATALADKDREIAKRDAEIAELKTKVLDAATLDKLVQSRATLVASARLLDKDAKTDGVADAEIRRQAVARVLGDAAVAGKSEAYIDARFDVLVEEAAKKAGAGADTFAAAVQTVTTADADKRRQEARDKMVADLTAPRATKAA